MSKNRTFVIGDIHGAYRALKQVIARSNFDYEQDKLIVLGDVADGWPEVAQCFEELLKIKNLVYVRGNHDQWLKDWLKEGKQPLIWTEQGGRNTLESYLTHPDFPEIGKKHLAFLKKTPCYYLDEENRAFVHGGIDLKKPITENGKQYLMWDRDLWDLRHRSDIRRLAIQQYKEIYVGHTSIYRFSHKPLQNCNIWYMDTGGGWEGVVSMMDIDTKEIFQSDVVKELYPEERGRN